MTRELIVSVLAVTITGKGHVTCTVSEKSRAMHFLSIKLLVVQQCPWSWFCHYVSAPSLVDWSVFPLIHVGFKEEMINIWLQVGSREASDGWEWHFMDCLSQLLVWSILLSIPLRGFLTNGKRHSKTSFEAGASNCRHFAALCIYCCMDKLDKPVSYKVGVVLFS